MFFVEVLGLIQVLSVNDGRGKDEEASAAGAGEQGQDHLLVERLSLSGPVLLEELGRHRE